jgi:hypothetical protein
MGFTVRRGKIVEIDILADPARLRKLDFKARRRIMPASANCFRGIGVCVCGTYGGTLFEPRVGRLRPTGCGIPRDGKG